MPEGVFSLFLAIKNSLKKNIKKTAEKFKT
jgi:hypothetical protein